MRGRKAVSAERRRKNFETGMTGKQPATVIHRRRPRSEGRGGKELDTAMAEAAGVAGMRWDRSKD